MQIVPTVLLALAGIVGVIPALALLAFRYRFPSWLDDLSTYETLLGAFMFAASLGLIGAVLTSRNQRIIANRQVVTERRKQTLAIGPKKQQIASEFIGEIDAIDNELYHESVRSAIENALRALETRTGKVDIEAVHIRKHVGRHFDRSPAEYRLLPSTISKQLTRFYTIVRETESDLEWYSHAIQAYASQRIQLMNPGQMIRLLRRVRDNIESSSRLRRTLIEGLKEVRDTNCDWSDRH
jgi:hypothetical protein